MNAARLSRFVGTHLLASRLHRWQEDLGRFHLSIVRGDMWPDAEGGAAWSASGDWVDSSTAQGPVGGRFGFGGRGAGGMKGPSAFKLKSKKKKVAS